MGQLTGTGIGLPTLKVMLEHVRYLVIRCRKGGAPD